MLGAVGAAGGVLVMWDSGLFIRVDRVVGARSVSCLLKTVENDKMSCSDLSREELWEELIAGNFLGV